ncbi:MAG: GAF domain-containing protein [Betaproteobacteria bacterium]|nr:GAF domain-containing protein [Betaproteobacteria bacterium]
MLSDAKLQLEELSSKQRALIEELEPQSESKLLDFYVRLIPRVLDAQRCSVFIHDPANGKVWLKAGTGVTERGIEVAMKDSIVGNVIASGKPVITIDLVSRDGAHKTVDTTTGFRTQDVICVPIHAKDRTKIAGAIEVLNKNSGGKFNEQDQAFLEEAAEHFQSAVESIFLTQQAVGISRNLIATASRAIFTSFVAVGASVFVTVLVSVYGGLPVIFG